MENHSEAMKKYWAKKRANQGVVQVNPKKRGPRTNAEKEVLRKNVSSRPVFLDALPTRGQKARAIALLSEQLKNISSSECVHYRVVEFVEKFKADKPLTQELAYVRNQLKVRGIKNPRVVQHDDIIYAWTSFNGNGKNEQKS